MLFPPGTPTDGGISAIQLDLPQRSIPWYENMIRIIPYFIDSYYLKRNAEETRPKIRNKFSVY